MSPRDCDWDTAPPPTLLNILAQRSPFSLMALQRLVVSPGPRVLRPEFRDAYCPRCFDEDVASGAIHTRRAWLDAWTFLCPTHRCLLGVYVPRVAPTLADRVMSRTGLKVLTASEQLRLGVTNLGIIGAFTPLDFWWNTASVRPAGPDGGLSGSAKWLDPAMLRSPLGCRLLMQAGSARAGELHYTLFLRNRPSHCCWKDGHGQAIDWPIARHPQAVMYGRTAAAYTASALWQAVDRTQCDVPPDMDWLPDLRQSLLTWCQAEVQRGTTARAHGNG